MAVYCNICGKSCSSFSRKQTVDGVVCLSCLEKAKVPGKSSLISVLTIDQIKDFIVDPDGYSRFKVDYYKELEVENQRKTEARQKHLEESAKRKQRADEEQKRRQQKQQLDQFGLDVESYTEEIIREYNAQSIANIAQHLSMSKIWSFGSSVLDDSAQNFSINMAKVQVEQNWILMRQNEQIIRLLEKLVNDKSPKAKEEERSDEV